MGQTIAIDMGVVIKETIRTSIVNYLGVLLGVVNVLWLQTFILKEGEIGLIKYILDWSLLIQPFVVMGANSLPIRFIHRFKRNKERNDFLSFILLIPVCTGVLFLGCFVLLKDQMHHFLGEDVLQYKSYFIYVVPLVFSYSYLIIFEGILQSQSDIFYSSLLKNVFIRVAFMLLLILFYYEIIDFYRMFQLYVLSYLVELVLLFVYFKKQIRFRFNFSLAFYKHPLRAEVINYSLFLIVGSGGLVLMNKVDVLMITDLMSGYGEALDFVGVYAVSFFIAAVIEMPKRVVSQLLYPTLSKLVTEGDRKEVVFLYKKSALNLSIIGLFLFLMVWYNLDSLFQIIPNGHIYAQGKWVVFFIGISKLSEMFFGVSQEVLIATKYYRYNLYLIPFLIVVTVLSNYMLIPVYGIVGAALATAITAVLYSLSRFLVIVYLLGMSSLSIGQIKVLLVLALVMLVYWFKPIFFDNCYLEILFNCVVISIVFIGGNLLLKSSVELNSTVDKVFGRG